MNQEDTRKFFQGKDYWYQYVLLNGYAWEPKRSGLKKLSNHLKLNVKHLMEYINFYLEA